MKAIVFEIKVQGWYGPYNNREIFLPEYNLSIENYGGDEIEINEASIDDYVECLYEEEIEILDIDAIRVLEIYELKNKIKQISKIVRDNFSSKYIDIKMNNVVCDKCGLETFTNTNTIDLSCMRCKDGKYKIKGY